MADAKRKWPWQVKHTSAYETLGRDVDDGSDRTSREEIRDDILEESRPAPTRWVSDATSGFSPYGFAEEDGGLRQVESGAWRRTFTAPTGPDQKRFVPHTASGPHRSPLNVRRQRRYSNTLVWQTFCAAVLVASAYYVSHTDKPKLTSIFTQTESMFQTDYTSRVQPMMGKAFTDLHLSVPAFGTSASKLHEPLSGAIVADYGANHPEVWIAGNSNSPVESVGSGTVLVVAKSGDTEIVKIDNGSFGTAIYAGLASARVKANDYVSGGEVVGRLPSAPSHPVLRFSLVKSGQYMNPHDDIQFAGGGQ